MNRVTGSSGSSTPLPARMPAATPSRDLETDMRMCGVDRAAMQDDNAVRVGRGEELIEVEARAVVLERERGKIGRRRRQDPDASRCVGNVGPRHAPAPML